jgi:ABC-type Zn uptake system ZnuABC Zn-binding protein ZnuA
MKAILLSVVLILTILPGCSKTEYAEIAATTLPVYQFASMLCEGTGISVTRLVTESVSCLHDYSLNVSQVRSVESAKVLVLSGGGLEDFMGDLVHQANVVIDSSLGIDILTCAAEGEEDHDHGHHHHEADAHFWLSPVNAKIMASNICNGLCSQFPQHANTLRANLTELHKKLDDLLSYGQQQLQELSCRDLLTFHDGFAYFAQAFDLTILEAIEEESGSEASARELIHLIELVETHQLSAIFTETNGSASAADVIARETGAKIFALDMAMAGDDYFQAMYHNIDTIREALG